MDPAAKIAPIRRLATTIYESLANASLDLDGPSACPAWDVGTTVAHLTGGSLRQCASMQRGLEGQHGPPDGNLTVTTPDDVQQRNAVSNRQLREAFGEELLTRFRDAYAELDDLLTSWTDWSIGCWHHRRGTMSADSYLDLRIQELVIHDWDMRSGGTGQAALDHNGILALLPVSEMWYELCFRPAPPLPRPLVYRFHINSESSEVRLHHDVSVSGDAFTISPPSDARAPHLTITCNAETYLLCLYGRVNWVSARTEGRLDVKSANPQTLKQDLMWFHERFGGL